MADALRDLLNIKANDIDLDNTRDDLHIIQTELDRLYPQAARVLNYNDGSLHVGTQSSSVASDLRLQKYTLTQNLNKVLKKKLQSLRISIR